MYTFAFYSICTEMEVLPYFEVLSQHQPGMSEENKKNPAALVQYLAIYRQRFSTFNPTLGQYPTMPIFNCSNHYRVNSLQQATMEFKLHKFENNRVQTIGHDLWHQNILSSLAHLLVNCFCYLYSCFRFVSVRRSE